MPDVILPRLADTLVEGTVTRWLKRRGERVARGEPLVEVETDKVNSELESPYEGVLADIVAPEGATVPVGEVIARIEEDSVRGAGEDSAEAAGEALAEAPPGRGRQEPVAEPRRATTADALPPLRRRIAERMQEARATIEQGSCSLQVDLSGNQVEGAWTARFVRALSRAGGYAEIGVAVEVPDGLVVPVVREVDRKTVAELADAIADLARRAREGQLLPGETTGGQFTVTNVGSVGSLMAFPLVNPGQPGILAPGTVVEGRCWLTLCYDRSAMSPEAAEALLERTAAALSAKDRAGRTPSAGDRRD
jgi:2-oxoglutarate dehydrogenase E2 component (dihydrolipoamide succinyltransferase)